MRKMKIIIVSLLLFSFAGISQAQKILNIWPAKAPGSESWNWQEQKDSLELPGDLLVYNVVQPTLLFFSGDPRIANGTSVIICPGGSFCYLHIITEGADVARWLNKKGVSAFVLEYRLVHSETNMPIKEKDERAKDSVNMVKIFTPLVFMAISDAKQAIKYVRSHAESLGVAS